LSSARRVEYPFEFTQIRGVRELSDGRLLVLELNPRVVYVIDSSGKRREQVGRQGDGPSEYRSPAQIFAIGNDSSLIVDGTNRKWYVLDGTKFINLSSRYRELQAMERMSVSGVSRGGAIWQLIGLDPRDARDPWSMPWLPDRSRRIALLRHGTVGVADTVAYLEGQSFGTTQRNVNNGGRSVLNVGITNPLQTHDQVGVFLDGAVAVAKFTPYRIDWITNSSYVRGVNLGEVATPVTRDLKLQAAAEFQRDEQGNPTFSVDDFPPWPTVVPPFLRSALVAGTDGRLYVSRTRIDPNAVRSVDVFDRTGRRLKSVVLPKSSRLLAVTARGWYIAAKTESDEEVLHRLSMPP
jgi:hypothetical protein